MKLFFLVLWISILTISLQLMIPILLAEVVR